MTNISQFWQCRFYIARQRKLWFVQRSINQKAEKPHWGARKIRELLVPLLGRRVGNRWVISILSSCSVVDLSLHEGNLRNTEAHREPGRQQLDEERHGLTLGVWNIVGEVGTWKRVTRHCAHFNTGSRFWRPKTSIETQPMPFRELQENGCVATDGDHTAGGRLRREPMFSQQLGALVKMEGPCDRESFESRRWAPQFSVRQARLPACRQQSGNLCNSIRRQRWAFPRRQDGFVRTCMKGEWFASCRYAFRDRQAKKEMDVASTSVPLSRIKFEQVAASP